MPEDIRKRLRLKGGSPFVLGEGGTGYERTDLGYVFLVAFREQYSKLGAHAVERSLTCFT
jgi:hypothetical protein